MKISAKKKELLKRSILTLYDHDFTTDEIALLLDIPKKIVMDYLHYGHPIKTFNLY